MSSVIKEKRKELGLTQEEIAIKMNITRQHYNHLENQRSKPSPALAKRIGEILGIPWTIFFD